MRSRIRRRIGAIFVVVAIAVVVIDWLVDVVYLPLSQEERDLAGHYALISTVSGTKRNASDLELLMTYQLIVLHKDRSTTLVTPSREEVYTKGCWHFHNQVLTVTEPRRILLAETGIGPLIPSVLRQTGLPILRHRELHLWTMVSPDKSGRVRFLMPGTAHDAMIVRIKEHYTLGPIQD